MPAALRAIFGAIWRGFLAALCDASGWRRSAADDRTLASGAAARRERRASSGDDLPTARGARGWHRQTLSVQQPQRLGHQIAAISPGAAIDSGDLPGADGLSLMGVLGVSEGAQHDTLLHGHAATLVARSDAVAAPHDRGANRAYSAENVPRIRTAEALRARRHRGRHASAWPGKGILGGVRVVAPHPTRCRLHARLSHKPCAAALEPLQGWVPKSRMSFAWSRPPSAPSAIPAAAAATTADVEQVIPDDFVQHPHAGAEASVRARLLLLGTNRSSRPGADPRESARSCHSTGAAERSSASSDG